MNEKKNWRQVFFRRPFRRVNVIVKGTNDTTLGNNTNGNYKWMDILLRRDFVKDGKSRHSVVPSNNIKQLRNICELRDYLF